MKFNNPRHALRWAYETTNTPIIKISSVNAMRGPDSAGGPAEGELTAYDRHAQAALILESMRARTARAASGLRPRPVRPGSRRIRHADAPPCRKFWHRGAQPAWIEQIIRAYCGEKIGLREIRKSMSCGTLKAAALRNGGYDVLDLIHAQAMDILDREMHSRGLLRTPDALATA